MPPKKPPKKPFQIKLQRTTTPNSASTKDEKKEKSEREKRKHNKTPPKEKRIFLCSKGAEHRTCIYRIFAAAGREKKE